nr:caspase family protein [Armatimonadota bacterium]
MRVHPFIPVVILAALCQPAGARAEGSTWALLVGCGKFRNTFISPLKYPGADAQAIHDALVDPKLGAVPASHIKLLVDDDATAANINDAVDNFLKAKVAAGDHVVIF